MDSLTRIYSDRPKAVLFTTAAALRILLALTFPDLPGLLTGRVEISTPTTSFKRLQEGLFLYERGLDPYDGGIFHQAPLLLPFFSLLPSSSTWFGTLVSILLYTGLDMLSANCVFDIAQSGAGAVTSCFASPRIPRAWKPASVAAAYLFNPFTLLSCLGRPTTTFSTFLTLLSLKHACQANPTASAFALAVAGYMSLHPVFLLPPIGLLCYDQICKQQIGQAIKTGGDIKTGRNGHNNKVVSDQRSMPSATSFGVLWSVIFTTTVAFLLGLSRLLLPSWNFVPSVYMVPLTLPDLTPNPGLWWYFFIEMFDAFRHFFLGVFWLHMLSYSIPFCIRFRAQPMAAVVLMMGVIAVFQPYANIGEVGAWLSCLCLLGHVFELCSTHRYAFPALTALLQASLLGPAFHHLWIYAGSGNANFFYAITLVWSLALLILLTDMVYAVLRDEWEAERPGVQGKETRQI